MRKALFVITIFLCAKIIIAQTSNLYLPLNIQKAIKNQTRTTKGVPGENYWQNRSDYKITAEVLPDSSYLIGDEQITYYNESPDTLKEIVIRLYQDIQKAGAVRDWYLGENNFNQGVELKYLIISEDSLDVSSQSSEIRRGSTNLIIKLKRALLPKTTLDLRIGWAFKIPKIHKIRMGNYGDGNLYIAYWYPQMAVYDDVDGWDKIDYSGMAEFYNDFSNYEVSIKVPKGMLVWATGELLNGEDVLRSDIFEKYEKAKLLDETVRIITQDDYEKGLVTAGNEINEWHFKVNNVVDFTFATSTKFNWDGASVVVDSSTGRRSLTDVIYQDGIAHYDKAAKYARETIEYLSHEVPGYPYPYSHATSYCNGSYGGGMESPMMANNGAPYDRPNHVGLIFHEISHNYFPFMMGNNERKYAWMDEGWAAFLPTELVDKYDPEFDYRKQRIDSYERGAGLESDLPLVIPSYSYKTGAARIGFYDRPASAYYELNELLGDEIFKKAMLLYINRWIGKHPVPSDFFFSINEAANEDLTWFWKPWFYEYGYPDLAIKNVERIGDEVVVKISMVGNIPTRVIVNFEYEDGKQESVSKSARVWKNGKKEIEVRIMAKNRISNISVGDKYIPDINKQNDIYIITD